MSKVIKRFFTPEMRAVANGPLEASWDTFPRSIDATISRTWTMLVARSRLAMNDDGFFSHFIQSAKDNIVGHKGFRVESTPPLNGGENIDTSAKDIIDDAWEDFSERGNFDVTGQLSRVMFEQLWIGTKAINGEALCQIVLDEGLPWGFGLQMIDPMRLDPQFNQDLNGGVKIRHSIEYNHYGRPIAYHVAEDTGADFYGSFGYSRQNRVRIPAEFVIHDFMPEFVGQKRGLPWARSILWRLRQFSRAEDSMIANLRASASKMGFFHNDGKEGEPKQAGDDDEEVEGNSDEIAIDHDDAQFFDIGNKRIVAYNPQFPDAAVEPFMRTLARGIASGLNGNYYKIFNDLTSVSFSSIRQGELSERDYWRSQQTYAIDSFVRPVRQAWLKYSLLAGRLSSPRRTLRPSRYSELRHASYKGRTWAWIDPQSEAAANALMLERNMKSLTDIISDYGEDIWAFIAKLKNEREEMKKNGIKLYTTPGAGVMASPGKAPVAEPST